MKIINYENDDFSKSATEYSISLSRIKFMVVLI